MKKLSAIRLVALCSVLLLIFSSAVLAAGKDQEKAKLDKLKRSISALEKRLDKRNQEKNTLVNALKKVEVEAAKTGKSIRQLTSKINHRNNRLTTLEKQQRDLQKKHQKPKFRDH